MSHRRVINGICMSVVGLLCVTALVLAAADSRVADAAMNGDRNTVRTLIKQAVDVNAAQGDGMTALHWAALNGDAEMAQMLVAAGANLKATTRLGAYTPLFMAGKSGESGIISVLLKAGADATTASSTGATALMMAATSGDPESVRLLLEKGADPNAKESDRGQTALAFAAAFNRPEAIKVLAQHGANLNLASNVIQPAASQRGAARGGVPQVGGARGAQNAAPVDAAAIVAAQARQNGGEENSKGGGNPKGGLTPLMYAARQGSYEAARSLLDLGASINAVNGDRSSALVLAIINGKFDIAKMLIDGGADVNLASVDGATPLYVVANTQWARKSFQPQPSPRYEKTTYLELMTLLLNRGANPNARLTKELWFSEYNRTLESASAVGTTAFWKCAEVGDVDGMRLLVSRGADPNVGSNEGVTPLLMVTGAGVHGNDDVSAPGGRLAAVKYLVEELHADVNAADIGAPARGGATQEQQDFGAARAGGGYTALHNAAARGDNEMILYLVSKGARPDAVTKRGITIVDMANGPRQRIQPYPETVALLELLGARNTYKCVSC